MRPFIRALILLALCLVPALPAGARVLSDQDRLLYRDAFAAIRSGDWPAAYRKALAAADPVLAKVVRFYDLSREGGTARFAEITEFATDNPDWPGQAMLRQRAEEAIGTGTDREIERWFEDVPPSTPFGKLRQADIWMTRGETDRAAAQIREAWIDGDFNAFEEKSVLQRYHSYLRPADHVKRLDRLMWDGRSSQVLRQLALVDGDYRKVADARLALGTMASNAERLLERVPPELQNDPGLLFDRMRWRRWKEMYEGAVDILDHAPTNVLRPQVWWGEREILARHALASGDISLAYRLAARHGLATGTSASYSEAEFLAGWIALRFLHDPATAYDHFVRLYDDVTRPISLSRGAYWAGRAAADQGYRQLADAWYATAARYLTTYYGQLAAAQIGADGKTAILEEPRPKPEEVRQFEQRDLVRVTRALAEAEAADYARPFVLRLADTAAAPADYALLARLAEEIGRPDLAITAAKRASYAGVTLLAEGYPLTDLPSGGSVERPLVLAMTRQESAFDPGALSTAGARGMMQLLLATAKRVAKSLGMPFSAKRLLGDARYNVTIGRAYLQGLLDNYSGSYVLAVAAYNAGPARVHQWVRDFGDPRARDVDVVDWVESIPYSETRNYVQRVLENLQIYRLRLGDRTLAFSLPVDLKR